MCGMGGPTGYRSCREVSVWRFAAARGLSASRTSGYQRRWGDRGYCSTRLPLRSNAVTLRALGEPSAEFDTGVFCHRSQPGSCFAEQWPTY